MYRPTYIKVDGNILENNVKNIISNYSDYKYYFGVVKNNAYHHGIYVIKYLIEGGVNYLAVSSLEEAISIRKYNLDIPILCLEPIDPLYVFDAINNNITLTIGSLDEAKDICENKYSDDLKVHLKVDSGMNRLGFKSSGDFYKAYQLLNEKKHIVIEGVYTHLATSGLKDPFYNEQIRRFLDVTEKIDLSKIPIVHIDRSLTLVTHEKCIFVNGVRLGISMYGYKQNINEGSFINRIKTKYLQKKYDISNVHFQNSLSLNYAFSLYSKVIELRKVKAGEFVGYGADYILKEDSIIATIPVGYADGVLKTFKYVYVKGKRFDIVAECMDMIMINVDKSVKLGDSVEVIGKNQSLKDVGARVGLSGHKFLNLFSNRVPIVYEYNGEKTEIKY